MIQQGRRYSILSTCTNQNIACINITQVWKNSFEKEDGTEDCSQVLPCMSVRLGVGRSCRC